jgi:hypothetical protein
VRWGWLCDFAVPEAWVRRVAMNLASDGFRPARRRLALDVRLRPFHPAPWAQLAVRHGQLPGPTEHQLRPLPPGCSSVKHLSDGPLGFLRPVLIPPVVKRG